MIGRRVRLDFSLVGDFTVFPGQIVVLEASNTTGSCLQVHSIYCDASHPMPTTPEALLQRYNESSGIPYINIFPGFEPHPFRVHGLSFRHTLIPIMNTSCQLISPLLLWFILFAVIA